MSVTFNRLEVDEDYGTDEQTLTQTKTSTEVSKRITG